MFGRFWYILLIIVVLSNIGFSLEMPISNFGFNNIEIIGPNQKICETITIPQNQEELRGILSIKAEFIGDLGDNTYLQVTFDDDFKTLVWPDNFNCKNNCFARIFIPKTSDDIKTEICLNAGGKAINSKIFSSSTIGFYDTPVIEIEHTSPGTIVLDERARMQIKVRNKGSKSAEIFVQFLAENLRDFLNITSFDIVEGDASARTTLKPGEEKEFVYYIKPIKSSSYNLPAAVLFFENIFEEYQKISSLHPQLIVLDKEQVSLLLISEELKENKFNFRAVIRNNWDESFSGELVLLPKDLILNNNLEIFLNPFEEKEILFSTIKLGAGNYSVLAQINQIEKEDIFVSESLEFVIKEKDYSFEIIFSALAIIISFSIFGWIYFQKN